MSPLVSALRDLCRSYWTLENITPKYVPVTSKLHVLINSACSIHDTSIGTVTPCNTDM